MVGSSGCAAVYMVAGELVTSGLVEARQSYLEGEMCDPERHV
jgi:hypothetical protein